jgi:hypothetical protein
MFVYVTSRKFHSIDDYRRAYGYIQELRQRIPNVNVQFYVSPKVLQDIHTALDIPLQLHQAQARQDDDAEVVDESM